MRHYPVDGVGGCQTATPYRSVRGVAVFVWGTRVGIVDVVVGGRRKLCQQLLARRGEPTESLRRPVQKLRGGLGGGNPPPVELTPRPR